MYKFFDIGLENIDFQENHPVVEALIDYFTEVEEKMEQGVIVDNKDIVRHKYDKKLIDIIKENIGIDSRIILNGRGQYYTYPPIARTQHIFARYNPKDVIISGDAESINSLKKTTQALAKQKVYIDLKRARVNVEGLSVCIGFNIIKGIMKYKLTPKELTAIMLHELGHVFTFVEFLNRTVRVNQVLTDISNRYKEDKRLEKFNYKLATVVDNKELAEEFLKLSKDKSTRTVWSLKTYTTVLKYAYSGLPDDIYTETTSEQLADQFATRMGMGEYLVSALAKLGGKRWTKTPWWYPAMELMRLLAFYSWIVLVPAIPSVAIALLAPLLLIWILSSLLYLLFSGSRFRDLTYDEINFRYRRIRHEMVESLKRLDLDKEAIKRTLEQIKIVDGYIKNARDYIPLLQRLLDNVFTTHNQAKKTIELERLLEDLVHNDLYIKSKEFETI